MSYDAHLDDELLRHAHTWTLRAHRLHSYGTQFLRMLRTNYLPLHVTVPLYAHPVPGARYALSVRYCRSFVLGTYCANARIVPTYG